ncbi:CaiB/BaiF CoA transferase family protein [Chloroflexota bacterium]
MTVSHPYLKIAIIRQERATLDTDEENRLALGPYRVLDLTDEKGMLCGRILGDLGADVIKVEKPGGDEARNIGPFYGDISHPERSLYWFAYNANKRGITLNLETSEGREIFQKLVKTSHFVIESFTPGYLEGLGLSYPWLSKANQAIILVSIAPFGQSGPYRDYKSSDIVAMAMGGLMYITGDADRPPVRVSVEQAYLHAGAQAAIGALLAHWYRELTGKGQWVDISIQESIIPTMPEILPQWQIAQHKIIRSGAYIFRGRAWQRAAWPCKDGQIGMRILTGVYAKAITPLIEWMDEEGMAGKLKDVNWEEIDVSQITQEEYDSWEGQFIKFFLRHTKEELYQEAVKRHIHLLPAYTPDELVKERQLASREYWTEVEHPELGISITYPGPFARLTRTPCPIRRRAPLIGEHNQEVYQKLGVSPEELVTLKGTNVI